MQRVFTSWSGGKDSCLACFRAARNNLEVRYLANMVTEDGQRLLEPGAFRLTAGGASPGPRAERLGSPRAVAADFTVTAPGR